MSTTKKAAEALRNAAAKAERTRAAAERIAAALTVTQAAAANDAGPDLEALRLAHQDTAAAHALGDATAEEVKAAAAALTAAEAAHAAAAAERDADRAIRAGLERKSAAAVEEASAAAAELEAAKLEWLRATLADAERDYLDAAEGIAKAHARHAAAVRALRNRLAPLPNAVTCALPLVLPTIGPESAARRADFRPQEHGIGADLAQVLAGDEGPSIEAELSDLTAPEKPGLLARAVKRLAA